MKNIRIYSCLSMLIALLASCDNYLVPKLTNDYGDSITWKLPAYAMGMLGEAYTAIDQNTSNYNGSGNYLDVATDNSLTTQSGSALYNYVFGSQTSTNDPLSKWAAAYNAIQIVNLFLEKAFSSGIIYNLSIPAYDAQLQTRSMGEAYFARAWWEMELLRNYGGLSGDGQALGFVIVTRTFSEDEKDMVNALPRNDFETCAQQIMADCDSAFNCLPLKYSTDINDKSPYGGAEVGRASGAASLALKSRVALMAASPAYQPAGNYALSQDSIRQKWLRAADVAQDALSKILADQSNMIAMTNEMIVGAAVNDVTDANSYNEMLFYRFLNGTGYEDNNYPPMWFGAGRCNPSQNLVNAYPMKNGYPITDPRSGYNSQNPYVNRDKRFTLQINYNGGKFNEGGSTGAERPMEIWASADDGSIGRDAPGYDYRNTQTGYYLRKGMSNLPNTLYNPDNPSNTDGTVNKNGTFHRNPLLRRMEIWMNLAEACNEYSGPQGVVPGVDAANTPVAIIEKLRSLYGTANDYVDELAALNNIPAFRDLILNERRIEFAFENMRLWDMRRWEIPLNTPIYGIKIYMYHDADGNKKYSYFGTTPGTDDVVVQNRDALSNPKYFSSPLPYNETLKDQNLVQNVGW